MSKWLCHANRSFPLFPSNNRKRLRGKAGKTGLLSSYIEEMDGSASGRSPLKIVGRGDGARCCQAPVLAAAAAAFNRAPRTYLTVKALQEEV